MRTHTKERPFTCDFPGCEACFTTSSSLSAHQRLHTGQKPFKCDFPGCDACFTTNGNMWVHRRSHSTRGQRRQRKKENRVAKFLSESNVTYGREVTVRFGDDEPGPRWARMDFKVCRTWGIDIVECDEHAHRLYDKDYDTKRMLRIFADIMKQGVEAGKIRFIRFNPDAYKRNGQRHRVSQQMRQTALLRVLNTEPTLHMSVVYLFYDRTGILPDVCLDAEYPNTLRAIASAAD